MVGPTQHDLVVSKLVRVRALTDPLGALGYRQTRQRIEREERARRTIFVAVLTAFVALLGLISRTPGPTSVSSGLATTNLVEEGKSTIVRIGARDASSHVRTRSTP
jgi:hypothetical protein